jgi:hypothetical protein
MHRDEGAGADRAGDEHLMFEHEAVRKNLDTLARRAA